MWKADQLMADSSVQRKMTPQRAQTPSDFAAGAGKKGKDLAFRCFRGIPTLATYYYRVVYQEDGHFSRDLGAPAPP